MRKLITLAIINLILVASSVAYGFKPFLLNKNNKAFISLSTNSKCAPVKGSIHCTTVAYNENIMTTYVEVIDFAGKWKNNTCVDKIKVFDESLSWGMKSGDMIVYGVYAPEFPKGYTCGTTIIKLGGRTFQDNYQLLTDAYGNYINSKPYEKDFSI